MVMNYAVSTQHRSNGNPLVRIRGLSKRFPVERDILGRPTSWLNAVEDVNLDIQPGETLGIIGESGCGKSTLARLILRLIAASSGSVQFEDIDVLEAASEELQRFREKAQIIFQDPFGSLDPRMNVFSVVSEGMDHLEMSKAEKRDRVAELLGYVGLSPDAMTRQPHGFSGGQRQRISIARALAVDPTFIVADEPTSALDVSIQGQILNLMQDLQAQFGLTYLFISHDMSVIWNVADRVAVMYLGKIVEVAPVEELFSNPLHPYTQALLSSIPSLLKTDKVGGRITLKGEISSPIDPPQACRFAGRCFRSIDKCHVEVPPLEGVDGSEDDHRVACFNYTHIDNIEVNS